jgi:hypothetical protein
MVLRYQLQGSVSGLRLDGWISSFFVGFCCMLSWMGMGVDGWMGTRVASSLHACRVGTGGRGAGDEDEKG